MEPITDKTVTGARALSPPLPVAALPLLPLRSALRPVPRSFPSFPSSLPSLPPVSSPSPFPFPLSHCLSHLFQAVHASNRYASSPMGEDDGGVSCRRRGVSVWEVEVPRELVQVVGPAPKPDNMVPAKGGGNVVLTFGTTGWLRKTVAMEQASRKGSQGSYPAQPPGTRASVPCPWHAGAGSQRGVTKNAQGITVGAMPSELSGSGGRDDDPRVAPSGRG